MSKIACVFPGQGSQSVGMLADLAAQYPVVAETFAEASQVLGYDLWQLVQQDEEGKLNQTQVTQPALLAASVAVWRVMQQSVSTKPDYLAGHSLGEYSALVCSGALAFKDGIKLVEARGNFMQQAVPAGAGAMYAIIGLDDDKVIQACHQAAEEVDEVVSAVNFNSPGQVVIAGTTGAAQKAADLCKEAGAKRALPLAVSAPSHCALMQPAAEKLAVMLEDIEISTPTIPVVNNVDVATPTSAEEIKQALVRQLYCPVRWTETVQFLVNEGVDTAYETGPGKVLAGLIKRIDRSVNAASINTPDSVQALTA